MTDTLEIFGTEYTGVTGIIATNDQSTDLTYIRPQGTKSITQNGTGIDVTEYASVDVNVSGSAGAISVVDTQDSHGGTIRTITAVDISDTTAVADDVAQGKYFYTADGTKTEGTSSGGGGGLEYETGTWTPSEDVYKQTITFTNAHSKPPMFVMMADATETDDQTASTNYGFAYSSFYAYTGQAVPSNETLNSRYALVDFCYRATGNPSQGTSAITNLTGSTASADEYWVTNTSFIAYTSSNSRYWRAGRTYKWIAVWAPTT